MTETNAAVISTFDIGHSVILWSLVIRPSSFHPMPVLPLFDCPADADAWHHVTAPGGYEWWHFEAEQVGPDGTPGGVRVVAGFFDGFAFHPEYLRRYERYLRRPTRRPPPVAGEYPCVCLAVYEGGRVLAKLVTQYPPGAFAASAERPDVRVGPNTLRRDEEGAFRLHLAGSPRRAAGGEVTADLVFRPRFSAPPVELAFPSRELSGADHRWVVANPVCAVDGAIRIAGAGGDGAGGREIRFSGRGYHDHHYGTAPLGRGVRRWARGRVLADDFALTFECAFPRDAAVPEEVRLIEADAAGAREVPVRRARVCWNRWSAAGLRWPGEIGLELETPDRRELELSGGRVIDSGACSVRASYTAAGLGAATCEVVYPHRLTWPVLGRMVRMNGREEAQKAQKSE
jgi:hypothetical protein